jgi:hypothetical protein
MSASLRAAVRLRKSGRPVCLAEPRADHLSADSKPRFFQLEVALSRWDNEGGALACRLLDDSELAKDIPQSIGTELEHLRVRVIALENLVISLLSQGPERPRALGRAMANFISPRPGFTEHPRTLAAASAMVHLVERAQHFQGWIEGELLT